MIELRGDWNIREWYEWLESEGLEIGRDFCWAWTDHNWAIEFMDPRMETMIRLKSRNTDLWSMPR